MTEPLASLAYLMGLGCEKVAVYCRACREGGTRDILDLVTLRGENIQLDQLGAKMRCTKCNTLGRWRFEPIVPSDPNARGLGGGEVVRTWRVRKGE